MHALSYTALSKEPFDIKEPLRQDARRVRPPWSKNGIP